MDYEQKCKEYLERAKEQLNGAKVFDYDNEQIAHAIRTTVYSIFPGLKESEDERIRKYLLSMFPDPNDTWDGIPARDIIAWLEKQGEKKELKDIEQNLAWSEEDEKILNEIFSVAARASLRKSTLFGKSYDYIKWQDWLKSLKDRVGNFDDGYKVGFSAAKHNQWKPSDEQIIALRWVLNNIPYNKHKEEISGLLDQIKEL